MIYQRWLLRIAMEILRQKANADVPKPQPRQSPDDLGVTWNGGSEFTIEADTRERLDKRGPQQSEQRAPLSRPVLAPMA